MISYNLDVFQAFNEDVEKLKLSGKNIIETAKEIIDFLEKKLNEINFWLKNYQFESEAQEIHFFKEIKPSLVSKLIYFKCILKIETLMPFEKDKKIKFLNKQLNEIRRFYKSNNVFNFYYRSKETNWDAMFFTRCERINHILTEPHLVNFDREISTSHDFIMAQFIANDMLYIYIENRINEINKSCTLEEIKIQSNLKWTASKIDLTELIYALYKSNSLNNGNADLKEITSTFEKIFNVEIGENISRKIIDIKNRKIERTKFLNTLVMTIEEDSENA